MEAQPTEADPKAQAVYDLANEKEMPLTEAEANMDYSKMHSLDLGDNKNYKTKMVQNRWEQRRNMWKTT